MRGKAQVFLQPFMEETGNQPAHHHKLGELADPDRMNHHLMPVQDHPAGNHGGLLRQDQGQRGPGGDALDDQGGGHADHHQLIGQRVHKLAEIGDQIEFTGDKPVGHVRQAGGHEHDQGGIEPILHHKIPENRNHRHAQHGEHIGHVPDFFLLLFSHVPFSRVVLNIEKARFHAFRTIIAFFPGFFNRVIRMGCS